MAQPLAPGWYPDPQDPSRNLYWDGRTWRSNGAPRALLDAPPPPKRKRHTFLWIIGTLLVLGFIGSQCSPSDTTSSHSSSTTAPTTVTSTPTTDARPAPSDAQIKEAFQAYIKERADSGVMLAESVTSVTVNDGVVTVVLDAAPAVLELSPFDNLAKLFGTPVAFNDDEGVWLRKTVRRVDVVDANGNSLGSLTATELNKMGVG